MTLTPATEQKNWISKRFGFKEEYQMASVGSHEPVIELTDERAIPYAGLDCDDQVAGTVYRELTKA
jgi:hypothetical protein